MAGCKPNCCTQPRATPWGNDVALIKVSRSEMSCKRGQSSLLGLPSAADIMKRATCFMRGNAPCGVKGVMGYALSARGIFAQRKNAECINRGLRFPRALPWAMVNIWAYSPPHSFTGRLCKLVHIHVPFLGIFGYARHSPNKFLKIRLLAMAKFE